MATGYNAASEAELIADYISYISIDTDESELESWKIQVPFFIVCVVRCVREKR